MVTPCNDTNIILSVLSQMQYILYYSIYVKIKKKNSLSPTIVLGISVWVIRNIRRSKEMIPIEVRKLAH